MSLRYLTSFSRATGSININITELLVLGDDWNSETLTGAYGILSSNSTSANVGDMVGNRVFYDNDYMASNTSLTIRLKRTEDIIPG